MRTHRIIPWAALLLVFAATAAPASADSGGPFLEPDWTHLFPSAGTDEGWGVEVGADGSVYIVGFRGTNGNDLFVAKLAPEGTELWVKDLAKPFSQKIFEAKAAGDFLYLGGAGARDFAATSQDMILYKLWASNGTEVWNTSWNGPGNLYDEIDGIVVDGSSVIVSGWADVPLSYAEGSAALVKFTLDGAFVTSRLWGGPGLDYANGGLASDGTNLYITGRTCGTSLIAGGDLYVAAFSRTDFHDVWNRTWGGVQSDDGYGLTLSGTHLYVVGLTLSFGGDRIVLLSYDTAGTLLWNTTWGAAGSESSRTVAVSGEGLELFVAGKTTSYGNGSTDIVVVRFAAGNGSLVGQRTWGGSGSETAEGLLFHGGSLYLAGSQGAAGGTDILAMKFAPIGTGAPDIPPGTPPGRVDAPGAAMVVGALAAGVVLSSTAGGLRPRP